ncbi:hypothetical protein [Candidatus Symbiopectobacterium sp. NZEC135]|uniref:hypothetical protein n=1 Tax=Candidatus Symbiopectobacterium sp. NZEC135 TaxID=2820471 RepID=UPI0022271211|nr:hypothetical protein [Candidatus Symbiopectobacterium sp. NZEC135]MCW2478367.1 hypothetical protein [Candidatus Symbiopectobacterium sp. NZEC135]
MISPTHLEGMNTVSKNISTPGNDDFDAMVLRYLTANHPEGNLQSILEKLKALAPNSPVTLTELSKAMNVANAKMHEESAHTEYANTVLSKKTMQLAGSNILYMTMINEIFFPTDENTVIEKY